MHNKNIGILASGRGTNAQAIFDAVNEGLIKANISIVISDNPVATVLARAETAGIESCYVEPSKFKDREAFDNAIAEKLEQYNVDLVVLAGFMRILTPGFGRRFAGRIMNIHPSLLPAFPGLDAQGQALRYGAKVAGCTVHFVDEGMDSGPIIMQQTVAVLPDDNPVSLANRILDAEHRIYTRAVQLFCEERLHIEGRIVTIRAGRSSDDDQ